MRLSASLLNARVALLLVAGHTVGLLGAASAAAAAPAEATCTLKRGIKVVYGMSIEPVAAGTSFTAAPPVGEWSRAVIDGRVARVSRRYLAVACVEGPLFVAASPAPAPPTTATTKPATTPPPTTPQTTTPTTAPAAVATTKPTTTKPATTPPGSGTATRPPAPSAVALAWPAPSPCKPAAMRQVLQVRQLARQGAGPAAVEEAAAAARLLDERCIEAHAWLAWAHRSAGEHIAALQTWDELWAAWNDVPPPAAGLRSLASMVAVHGRLQTLRELPPVPLPAIADAPVAGTTAPGTSVATGGAPLRVAVVGDVHMGRGWPSVVVPPAEGAGFFDAVAPALTSATLTLANLETALADAGESHKCSDSARAAGICFSFRAPTFMARRLAAAGVDVVSLANNHAADFGFTGLRSTTDALAAAGIAAVGLGSQTTSFVVNGARVGFASFSVGSLDLGMRDLAAMQQLVARLDAAHDVVVVMFHGGAEGLDCMHVPRAVERYLGEHRGDVWAFAHAAVDAGADLVFGSGPHVLRGVEVYRGRLVAYSLGNFSSWFTFPTTGLFARSGVLDVELAKNGVALSAQLHATTMERSGRPIPDPDGVAIAEVRRLSQQDFGDAFFDEAGRWVRGRRAPPWTPPVLAARDEGRSGALSGARSGARSGALVAVGGAGPRAAAPAAPASSSTAASASAATAAPPPRVLALGAPGTTAPGTTAPTTKAPGTTAVSAAATTTSSPSPAAAAAAGASAGSTAAGRAAAVGRTCTLGRETLVWREGRFVPAAAGTALTLGARGPQFTEVSLPDGSARIANALLWRCR